MNIANNTVVTMHYTVSTTDGTQIDSSRDGEPMVHLQGSQYLIQGLENALTDKVKGDTLCCCCNIQKKLMAIVMSN